MYQQDRIRHGANTARELAAILVQLKHGFRDDSSKVEKLHERLKELGDDAAMRLAETLATDAEERLIAVREVGRAMERVAEFLECIESGRPSVPPPSTAPVAA